jgi:3,4-dihydroxy 2-butanone 4-phosphate synthase
MPEFDIEPETTLGQAVEALNKGEFVLVYDADGREEETDLTIASQYATSEALGTLRRDGGGLVCTTVDPTSRRLLGMPYLTDILSSEGKDYPLLNELIPNDIPYDSKSSFAITINHRKTFTGITDSDRALTIRSFAEYMMDNRDERAEDVQKGFGELFRAPGHVFLLNANDGLCNERQGHTELCTALVVMAGLFPSATICEMMAETGHARTRAAAEAYAKQNGLVYISGTEIVEAWKKWSE